MSGVPRHSGALSTSASGGYWSSRRSATGAGTRGTARFVLDDPYTAAAAPARLNLSADLHALTAVRRAGHPVAEPSVAGSAQLDLEVPTPASTERRDRTTLRGPVECAHNDSIRHVVAAVELRLPVWIVAGGCRSGREMRGEPAGP